MKELSKKLATKSYDVVLNQMTGEDIIEAKKEKIVIKDNFELEAKKLLDEKFKKFNDLY